MAQQDELRGGKGRRDEVGKTGIYPATGPYPEGEAPIVTPGDINAGTGPQGPGVEVNEDLKSSERLPRKGNEEDKPESDRLSD
jgi:hypothetical protein